MKEHDRTRLRTRSSATPVRRQPWRVPSRRWPPRRRRSWSRSSNRS